MADKGPFAGIEVYKAEWSSEGYLVLYLQACDQYAYTYLRHRGNIVSTGGKTWRIKNSGRIVYNYRKQQLPYTMTLKLKEC